MSLAPVKRGRINGDPIGSEKPRGKDRSMRKSGRDKGFTPTESRKKDQLMKQFCKLEGPSGNSAAYINSPVWCKCGRGMNRRAGHGDTIPCIKCRPDLKEAAQ